MRDLVEQGSANFVMQKKGVGRLYYRLGSYSRQCHLSRVTNGLVFVAGMTYAPLSLALKPANYGFLVSRKYAGVENADDAKLGDDGVWTFKVGKKVWCGEQLCVACTCPSVVIVHA